MGEVPIRQAFADAGDAGGHGIIAGSVVETSEAGPAQTSARRQQHSHLVNISYVAPVPGTSMVLQK